MLKSGNNYGFFGVVAAGLGVVAAGLGVVVLGAAAPAGLAAGGPPAGYSALYALTSSLVMTLPWFAQRTVCVLETSSTAA